MPQTIDVTGLPPTVVADLQRLVDTLRAHAAPAVTPPPVDAPRIGAPPNETPEQWAARLVAWVQSHPKRAIEFDDSRESIYEGRGE
jgi:hypothetical protein